MASKAEGASLISGLATWNDVAAIDGNVLLIINSPAGDERAFGRVLDELEGRVLPERLHIVAASDWHGWLRNRGWSDARVLFSADAAGRELELNYFLESPAALRWIVTRQFSAVVGSAPHNLYNEEVKDIFERRVGIFLGGGRFLAHTLPQPYVFVLELADLLQRFNRGRKADDYAAVCRAMIDDLYRLWVEGGKPPVSDGRSCDGLTAVLARHLGSDALSWDEVSPIPLRRPDAGAPAAGFLSHLETVLHHAHGARDDEVVNLKVLVADLQRTFVQLQDEINHRDRLLADFGQKANQLQRAIGDQQDEINRRDEMLRELTASALDLQKALESQQAETNQRDAMLEELSGQIAELQRGLDRQQQETNRRDRRLAELQDERVRDVEIRDQRLADLHRELAREMEIRDRRLVELQEELTHEVRIRDQKLVEMYEERRGAVAERDAIIEDLRRGWRGWIVKRR